jgi:hypothetical protein
LGVYCPNKEVYNERESKTAKNTGQPFTIQYGIGATKGYIFEDYFAVCFFFKLKNEV